MGAWNVYQGCTKLEHFFPVGALFLYFLSFFETLFPKLYSILILLPSLCLGSQLLGILVPRLVIAPWYWIPRGWSVSTLCPSFCCLFVLLSRPDRSIYDRQDISWAMQSRQGVKLTYIRFYPHLESSVRIWLIPPVWLSFTTIIFAAFWTFIYMQCTHILLFTFYSLLYWPQSVFKNRYSITFNSLILDSGCVFLCCAPFLITEFFLYSTFAVNLSLTFYIILHRIRMVLFWGYFRSGGTPVCISMMNNIPVWNPISRLAFVPPAWISFYW